ncbi:MAG: type II toxin-antitoxin system CcdA family antitoxin [Rhodocyclales bacterium]|nr:type II toxin-antitoxin system CcdA family antitoxin [Rhodocyclales bacterium]
MIVRISEAWRNEMTALHKPIAKKGRVTLSIDQDVLDRLEPYKHQINLSAQAERLFSDMAETLESLAWAERNAGALAAHGSDIARTGLAGAEFDRI